MAKVGEYNDQRVVTAARESLLRELERVVGSLPAEALLIRLERLIDVKIANMSEPRVY